MQKKQILSLILLMLIGMQISSYAQDSKLNDPSAVNRPFQHGQGEFKNLPPLPPPPPPVLPGIPNLSKEQSEKIKNLQIELALIKQPLENKVREKEAGLHSISTIKSPDIKAIEKQIDEIGTIKIQLAKLQANHDQDIRKILDDEQRLIFDKRPPMHEPRPF
jgi:hypothetical protein